MEAEVFSDNEAEDEEEQEGDEGAAQSGRQLVAAIVDWPLDDGGQVGDAGAGSAASASAMPASASLGRVCASGSGASALSATASFDRPCGEEVPEEPLPDAGPELPTLKITKAGAFLFTAKKGNKFPGFQATCPYHQKNEVTTCKHFIQAQGHLLSHRKEAFHRLLYWCTQHGNYDRVWTHQRCHVPQVSDLPAAHVLWAQVSATEKPVQKPELDSIKDAQQLRRKRGAQAATTTEVAEPKAAIPRHPSPRYPLPISQCTLNV
eukprot:2962078-Amphidinium_carterae.1